MCRWLAGYGHKCVGGILHVDIRVHVHMSRYLCLCRCMHCVCVHWHVFFKANIC